MTAKLVPHRCPVCGETVGAFPSAVVEHACPKRKPGGPRYTRFVVDAQPSESKGK